MTSTLENTLNDDLKTAMRAGADIAKLAIRAIKTDIMKKRTARAGVEITDELVQDTIRAYVKMLQGSVEELVGGGAAPDEANIVQMLAEIAFLDRYLPKLADEAETAAIVQAVLTANAITDPKMAGRATGLVIKDNKGKVDPGLVAKAVRAALGA